MDIVARLKQLCLRHVLPPLSALIALLFAATPAAAQIPTPPVPGCQYAVGDIFDSASDGAMKTYDGAKITSPEQLAGYAQEAGDKTIRVEGGDFSAWDFTGVELSNICFVKSNLSQSNWAGVTARGLGFIDSNVEAAVMSGAVMTDILIRSSSFARVNATGADWTSGKLDGGWAGDVTGLKLDEANLTGFRFDCGITVPDGCPLARSGISARGANLAFSDWSSFGFSDADLTGALLRQTVISPRQLTDFKDAMTMGGVSLSGGDEKVMMLPETWAVMMASALAAVPEDVPSFKCEDAETGIERAICAESNSDIRRSDRHMAALYKEARKRGIAVEESQKAWLARRSRCTVVQYLDRCLRNAYDQRIGQLIGLLGEGDWLPVGEDALFLEEVLPLGEDVVSSSSYVDLVPILAGAARSSLLVKRSFDGSLEAYGDAIGANAHLCSLHVKGLRFDPATGWYSLSALEDGVTRRFPVLRYYDGRIEVYRGGRLQDGEEWPSTDEEDGSYVSCGARASFPPMVRIDAPLDLMARYRRAAKEER